MTLLWLTAFGIVWSRAFKNELLMPLGNVDFVTLKELSGFNLEQKFECGMGQTVLLPLHHPLSYCLSKKSVLVNMVLWFLQWVKLWS